MRVLVCALVASACLLLVVPTQGRYVKGDRYIVEAETHPEDVGKGGTHGIEQGVTGSPHDDPDWVPQPDDYVVDDNNYVYDADYSDEDYGDDDYYDYDDEENKLWSSDDDPDWTPDDTTRFDILVRRIAQSIVNSPYNQQPVRSQEEIEKILRDQNPSLEELTLMVAMLVKQNRYGYDSREDTSREYVSQEDTSREHLSNELLSLEHNSQENELFSQEQDAAQYYHKGKRSLAKKVKREALHGD